MKSTVGQLTAAAGLAATANVPATTASIAVKRNALARNLAISIDPPQEPSVTVASWMMSAVGAAGDYLSSNSGVSLMSAFSIL